MKTVFIFLGLSVLASACFAQSTYVEGDTTFHPLTIKQLQYCEDLLIMEMENYDGSHPKANLHLNEAFQLRDDGLIMKWAGIGGFAVGTALELWSSFSYDGTIGHVIVGGVLAIGGITSWIIGNKKLNRSVLELSKAVYYINE